MAIASPRSQKGRYSILITAFFALFLFSLFCFSKRALEPSLSISYSHFLPYPFTISSTTNKPTTQEDIYLISTNTPTPCPITQHLSFSSATTTPTPTPKPDSSSSTTIKEDLPQPPSKHPQPIVSSVPLPSPSHAHSQSLLSNASPPAAAATFAEDRHLPSKNVEKEKECDLYTGQWVRDESYPLYQPGSCLHVDEAFSCQHNGRPDVGYLNWRWKPSGCDLPRYMFVLLF